MTAFVAGLAAFGVFLAVSRRHPPAMAHRIGDYIAPAARSGPAHTDFPTRSELAGYAWTPVMTHTRFVAAAIAGATVGLLLDQGELGAVGLNSSPLAMTLLGATAGGITFSMHLSTRRQRRARRLRSELPIAADAIALGVIAGESVSGALQRFVAEAGGVVAEELSRALDAHRAGDDLAAALAIAGERTVHADAQRLYTMLGTAHVTGGRLADGLVELAADLRAGLGRDLTAQSGRRAVAAYGPILALMVPVTLLFLIYPTIAGLRSLAHG